MLLSMFLIVFCYVNGSSGVRPTKGSKTPHDPKANKMYCGVDLYPDDIVQDGLSDIKRFPWLGLLIYPIDNSSPTTTAVVLITRQIAVTTALDIDYYPKEDFRARSRVILGNNCTGPYIRILDYSFYPDFTRNTYSSLALLQLDTKKLWIKVYHICPPPEEFENPEIFALNIVNDCHNSSMVAVYKMEYVESMVCREFYRKAGLYMESMRPSYVVCAKGKRGGHCIWRSGTALVLRLGGYWRLLGLGTYGPGCESPARFLDYTSYRAWVQTSITMIGQPTITRIGPGHIIVRRTTTNIPRYGPCDPEETREEIFSDVSTIVPPPYAEMDPELEPVDYNMTLLENVEYHCIIVQASNIADIDVATEPQITLHRWCTKLQPLCADFSSLKVYFFVKIDVKRPCYFKVTAYGINIKYVNEKTVEHFIKKWEPRLYGTLHRSQL